MDNDWIPSALGVGAGILTAGIPQWFRRKNNQQEAASTAVSTIAAALSALEAENMRIRGELESQTMKITDLGRQLRDLEKVEQENRFLKAENAVLRNELDRLRSRGTNAG